MFLFLKIQENRISLSKDTTHLTEPTTS